MNFGHPGAMRLKLENFTMHHGLRGLAGLRGAAYLNSEACLQRRRWRTSEIPSFPLEFLTLRRVLCGSRSLNTQSDKRLTPVSSVLSCLRPTGQAYVDTTVTADEMRAGFDVIGGQGTMTNKAIPDCQLPRWFRHPCGSGPVDQGTGGTILKKPEALCHLERGI